MKLTPMPELEPTIDWVKQEARNASAQGKEARLRECIDWLEANWQDHRAAQAFYTELERMAPQ
jgi:hypothetical protein